MPKIRRSSINATTDRTDPRVLTTYPVEWPSVMFVDRQKMSRLRLVSSLFRQARLADVVLLNGGVSMQHLYDELLIAGALAHHHPHLPIVLAECWWEAGSRHMNMLRQIQSPPAVDAPARYVGAATMARALKSIDHPAIHYCVAARSERSVFASRWQIPQERVHFVPYHANAQDERQRHSSSGVFAGGDTLRDYRPLLTAAPLISAPIRIATRLRPPAVIPANVEFGPASSAEYAELAASARTVVVALRADAPRSAGQQTYLDSMLRGIPVVVTESMGVRDYVTPEVTGQVVQPSPDALAAGIGRALIHGVDIEQMVIAARNVVLEKYTPERYSERLRSLCVQLHDQRCGRLAR